MCRKERAGEGGVAVALPPKAKETATDAARLTNAKLLRDGFRI
jgi:hypothetical protein